MALEERGPLKGGRGCEGWTGCLYWWLSAHACLWNCLVGRYHSLLRKETLWSCSSAHIVASCQKFLHQHISEIKRNEALFILVIDQAFLLCVPIHICAKNFGKEWIASTKTGRVGSSDSTPVLSIISFCYVTFLLGKSVLTTSIQWQKHNSLAWLLTYICHRVWVTFIPTVWHTNNHLQCKLISAVTLRQRDIFTCVQNE